MNGAQKKQLTTAAQRDVLASAIESAEGVVLGFRKQRNVMADYGATAVLVKLREMLDVLK